MIRLSKLKLEYIRKRQDNALFRSTKMHQNTIDRSSFYYWINGNGAWDDHFTSSSDDLLICLITILLTTSLFVLHIVFAWQNYIAAKNAQTSHKLAYNISIIRLFITCGLLHFINGVIDWIVPIYYISNAICIYGIIQAFILVVSKSRILADEEYERGIRAQNINSSILKILESECVDLSDKLNKVREVLHKPD